MTLIQGDALQLPLPDKSVHCCITSPPYWGLRDYGTAKWVGGDAGCDHRKKDAGIAARKSTLGPNKDGLGPDNQTHQADTPFKHTCGKCGAIREDDQLGLESTPDEYIAKMVQVFREVWRVLRDDGCLWLNMGDSYAQASSRKGQNNSNHDGQYANSSFRDSRYSQGVNVKAPPGLKPKDLCGMPWRLALALQADGWYLRSDIIWHKPNPMPESVTDRPTKSHEYVFLLTKNKRYFYDADSIREKQDEPIRRPTEFRGGNLYDVFNNSKEGVRHKSHDERLVAGVGRNRRTVWTIATAPYSGAHFATFPPKLIEPMIKAGTSERGCCPECGNQWERVVESHYDESSGKYARAENERYVYGRETGLGITTGAMGRAKKITTTTGFRPTCDHDQAPIPSTVLDPFVGSGTTVQVARSLGRHGIGVDLSAEYLQLARQRLGLDKWDDWGKGITDDASYEGLPLFGDSEAQ